MTSPRSFSSGSIIGIVVPGTLVGGLTENSSSVLGLHITSKAFRAGEYMAKSGWLAALRPTRPTMFGPVAGPPGSWLTAWQMPQRSRRSSYRFRHWPLSAASTAGTVNRAASASSRERVTDMDGKSPKGRGPGLREILAKALLCPSEEGNTPAPSSELQFISSCVGRRWMLTLSFAARTWIVIQADSTRTDTMSKQSRSLLLASLLPGFLIVNVSAVVQAQEARSAAASRWSDPASWPDRRVPLAGEKATIAAGKEVVLDISPPALRSLIIQGKLSFSDESDLELATDWVYVPGGELASAPKRARTLARPRLR